MGVLARGKSCSVKPGQVVEVVAIGHAVEVSGDSQAFSGRGELVAGVVLGRLLVGAGVVSGAG